MMNLSSYQKEIRDWVRSGEGSAVVDAKAGTGKTFTLVNVVAPEIDGDALFCAFNKHIATELGRKLPNTVRVATIHSIGFGAIRRRYGRVKVDAKKMGDLINHEVDKIVDGVGPHADYLSDYATRKDIWGKARKLADLVRVTLTDPTDKRAILELAYAQDIILAPPIEVEIVGRILKGALNRCKALAKNIVDFADMIWLPNVDQSLELDQYKWVLVDEAQDLSAAQLAIVKGSLAEGGRLLAVGDPNQAIYAFAGADCDSFKRVTEFAGGKVLPLNVCYRCPESHIKLAQQIVPTIEAAEGAYEGEVLEVGVDDLGSATKSGDLILCRLTAPLVSTCLSLVRGGTRAYVRGQNLAGSLKSIVRSAAGKRSGLSVEYVLGKVDGWLNDRLAEMEEAGLSNDSASRIALIDKVEIIHVIGGDIGMTASVEAMFKVFEDLFRERDDSVVLSTVHRAKGLEADNVFILNQEKMPLHFVTRPDALQQEWNLRYVALTRAKKTLTFIVE
jgi:DNA helicase-2/ATP-dependent DNA helicase PcrA